MVIPASYRLTKTSTFSSVRLLCLRLTPAPEGPSARTRGSTPTAAAARRAKLHPGTRPARRVPPQPSPAVPACVREVGRVIAQRVALLAWSAASPVAYSGSTSAVVSSNVAQPRPVECLIRNIFGCWTRVAELRVQQQSTAAR
jgi:hypothetical protein